LTKLQQDLIKALVVLVQQVRLDLLNLSEGITKLASGIKAYRLKLGEILKAYEQIDAIVEKVIKSDLYPRILKILLIEKAMSTSDIAKKLGENERKVYDTCYNLTRDRWTPSPLEYSNSGEWTLTISGEILASRLLEKHPDKAELQTARTASTL
jgi:hypothetical protein